MIKLPVFKQKFLYHYVGTILYQLRLNTVSKHKWGYKLQNFPMAAPPPAPKPISYLHYETICTCQLSQVLTLLEYFPMHYHFPNHWSIQIPFYFHDKALILKCVLILSNTNTRIWSKKSMGPYVAKMFFLQSKLMKVSG